MDFHEGASWNLTIPTVCPCPDTCAYQSDLENAAAIDGNLEDRRESNMVRMFRRLLRGGGRQRVTGVWIL